jgi:hypothetical protein
MLDELEAFLVHAITYIVCVSCPQSQVKGKKNCLTRNQDTGLHRLRQLSPSRLGIAAWSAKTVLA